MQPASLILSSPDDINLRAAEWGLLLNGIQPFSGQSIADEAFGPWSIDMEETDIWTARGSFSNYQVRSVWCHRPRAPKILHGVPVEDVEFAEREWLFMQKNLFALSTHAIEALWVNEYRCAIEAENKLLQLRTARRVGIDIPETLVSNDPAKVRKFIAKHGKVIYKQFNPFGWTDPLTGRCHNTIVSVLPDIETIGDASIAICPGIYQPYVEKICDLRVTVIGDLFFPVRIANSGGEAFVDWRPRTLMSDLTARSCGLPAPYQAKLARLMRELGLVYGCIDLALDANGTLYFFEVNQTGQYLFVEEWLPELPLLKAMCALLAQGRVDYSLDSAADISYAQYQRTDGYALWRSEKQASLAQILPMVSFGERHGGSA